MVAQSFFSNLFGDKNKKMNICNYFLFNHVDDIVDRVPNSRIEQNYGSLIPSDIGVPSDFWQVVLGPDYVNDIKVIALWNNSDVETTTKTLNLFGGMFLETQETANGVLNTHDKDEKNSLRRSLTRQNGFISWVAAQLCVDVSSLCGDPDIDSKYRLNVFSDCARMMTIYDLKKLSSYYQKKFIDYDINYPLTNAGQNRNDLKDVLKDLGIYKDLYPYHVTTNAVLTDYQCSNPDFDLIDISSDHEDVVCQQHPLYNSFHKIAHHSGCFPAKQHVFDRERDIPEFKCIGDIQKWKIIKQSTLLKAHALSMLGIRRQEDNVISKPVSGRTFSP